MKAIDASDRFIERSERTVSESDRSSRNVHDAIGEDRGNAGDRLRRIAQVYGSDRCVLQLTRRCNGRRRGDRSEFKKLAAVEL
jgi:hypothetical protein